MATTDVWKARKVGSIFIGNDAIKHGQRKYRYIARSFQQTN